MTRIHTCTGIALPERHSVHVRGMSLHQFMGWVLGLSRVRGNVEVSDFESTVLQFHIFLKNRKGLLERTAIQQVSPGSTLRVILRDFCLHISRLLARVHTACALTRPGQTVDGQKQA